jgi:hypothetical protein
MTLAKVKPCPVHGAVAELAEELASELAAALTAEEGEG